MLFNWNVVLLDLRWFFLWRRIVGWFCLFLQILLGRMLDTLKLCRGLQIIVFLIKTNGPPVFFLLNTVKQGDSGRFLTSTLNIVLKKVQILKDSKRRSQNSRLISPDHFLKFQIDIWTFCFENKSPTYKFPELWFLNFGWTK